jgi:acetyltransferase-like isoleucine patch superfamily enzyme
LGPAARRLVLRAISRADRLRLAWLRGLHQGLQVDARASSNLAVARYRLAPGAILRLAAGVVTERRPGALSFLLEEDARIDVEEGAWLRTEISPITLVAFRGARLRVGPESLLNGCHLSAKREVVLGRRVFVGPGTRVFDADQHDLDAEHPERVEPVHLGDHAWIASDVTVLRGVRVGSHAVVGARSLVTADIPPHTLAFGTPARPRGTVGDRSTAR